MVLTSVCFFFCSDDIARIKIEDAPDPINDFVDELYMKNDATRDLLLYLLRSKRTPSGNDSIQTPSFAEVRPADQAAAAEYDDDDDDFPPSPPPPPPPPPRQRKSHALTRPS